MGRRLALLIATYEYEDGGLQQLTAPAHDAEALGAVLRDPAIAGFEVTPWSTSHIMSSAGPSLTSTVTGAPTI